MVFSGGSNIGKPSSLIVSQCGRKAVSELGCCEEDHLIGHHTNTLRHQNKSFHLSRPQVLKSRSATPEKPPPPPPDVVTAQQLQQQQHHQQQAGRLSAWRLQTNPVHTLSTFTPPPPAYNQYQPLYHNSSKSEPSSHS